MLEKFYIVFVVLQKIIAIIKKPFSTLRKLCCSYYTEKRKIRPKNPVGRKCSVVIIMSVFYPLETFDNGAKNRQWLDYT